MPIPMGFIPDTKVGKGGKVLFKKDSKAQRFLTHFSMCGNVKRAAELAQPDSPDVLRKKVYRWKKNCKAFREAFDIAREMGDSNIVDDVESALAKRAMGYQFDEVVSKRVKVKDPETGETIFTEEVVPVKITKKDMPPDAGAAKFILQARDKERWPSIKEDGINLEPLHLTLNIGIAQGKEPQCLTVSTHRQKQLTDSTVQTHSTEC